MEEHRLDRVSARVSDLNPRQPLPDACDVSSKILVKLGRLLPDDEFVHHEGSCAVEVLDRRLRRQERQFAVDRIGGRRRRASGKDQTDLSGEFHVARVAHDCKLKVFTRRNQLSEHLNIVTRWAAIIAIEEVESLADEMAQCGNQSRANQALALCASLVTLIDAPAVVSRPQEALVGAA
jgi:hypothetical protein